MILCLVPKNTFFGVQPKSSTIILRQSHTPHKSSLGRMEMAELDRKCTRPSSDVNDPQSNLWTPFRKVAGGLPEKGNVFKQTLQNCVFSLRNQNRFLCLQVGRMFPWSSLIMQTTLPPLVGMSETPGIILRVARWRVLLRSIPLYYPWWNGPPHPRPRRRVRRGRGPHVTKGNMG